MEGDQLFLAVGSRFLDDQSALPTLLESEIELETVDPGVDIAFPTKVALGQYWCPVPSSP